jgi:ankyrin repeat protein
MMLKSVTSTMLALIIVVPAWAGAVEDKALCDAAYALNIEAVKIALKKGADPNTSLNGKSRTPLSSVSLGNVSAKFGEPPMPNADKEAVAIARILFAQGAKIGRNDRNILFWPIFSGNVELVGLLIEKGASLTAKDGDYTPAEFAKKHGQEAIYELLVSRGGTPVDSRSSAQLALVDAAGIHDLERMESAIKSGARINDFDAAKRPL